MASNSKLTTTTKPRRAAAFSHLVKETLAHTPSKQISKQTKPAARDLQHAPISGAGTDWHVPLLGAAIWVGPGLSSWQKSPKVGQLLLPPPQTTPSPQYKERRKTKTFRKGECAVKSECWQVSFRFGKVHFRKHWADYSLFPSGDDTQCCRCTEAVGMALPLHSSLCST